MNGFFGEILSGEILCKKILGKDSCKGDSHKITRRFL